MQKKQKAGFLWLLTFPDLSLSKEVKFLQQLLFKLPGTSHDN